MTSSSSSTASGSPSAVAPGTAQAKTWVSLEPGFKVLDDPTGDSIVVEQDGVRVH